jgi:hypothetical protein
VRLAILQRMAPARHRGRSRLIGAAAVVLAWHRHEVNSGISGFMSDHTRALGEFAAQLAVIAALALLPLVLVAGLLFVALSWIRRTITRMRRRALPFAVATWLALKVALVLPRPSTHMLTPRPVV